MSHYQTKRLLQSIHLRVHASSLPGEVFLVHVPEVPFDVMSDMTKKANMRNKNAKEDNIEAVLRNKNAKEGKQECERRRH
jgi:hypothetical protein